MEWTNIFIHNPSEPLLFHTGVFLFLFSLFLIAYSFIYQNQKIRNIALIIFGFYFYYKASGLFLILLITSLSADYIFSKWIHNCKKTKLKKLILIFGILFSLSFLVYFKYSNFFLENISYLTHTNYILSDFILPIGISFYTFQSISYLVDVYQNKIQPSGFINYMLYMTFFPHLVAGPIVRAKDFLPQIKKPTKLNKGNINEAFYLITKGFIKKAIIADFIAQYADSVFSTPDGFSGAEHLISSLCYTLQIFCDFSGYTDMAIGIALLLGFRLCVNFDSPYKSLNITNFWHRWHISLSSWLRDYVYIPFGGNKKGFSLQMLFLLLTMLIGGFWHGANWKFIFWGAGHGILLILHKIFLLKFPKKIDNPIFNFVSWLFTFICVSLLWIPFRAGSIEETIFIYNKIFTDIDFKYFSAIYFSNTLLIYFLLIGYTLTLLPNTIKEFVKKQFYDANIITKFVILGILIQLFLQVKSSSIQPFIYFQF